MPPKMPQNRPPNRPQNSRESEPRKREFRKIGAITSVIIAGLTIAGAAEAGRYNSGTVRVVGIAGNAGLELHVRPNDYSNTVAVLPFNAVNVERRRSRGNWVKISYNGVRGWAQQNYLAPEDGDQPLYYRVTNLEGYGTLNIRRRARRSSRVIGNIPEHGGQILACGDCRGDWCPIRYKGKNGWAHKNYLVVERTTYSDDQYGDDESYSNGYDVSESDVDDWRIDRRREARRRNKWWRPAVSRRWSQYGY